jgi:hypothetical protein
MSKAEENVKRIESDMEERERSERIGHGVD